MEKDSLELEITKDNFEAVDVPIVIKKEPEDYPTTETVNFEEELNKDPLELKEEIEISETHVSNLEVSRPIDNGNSSEEEKGKRKKTLLSDLSLKKRKSFECNLCEKSYSRKQYLQMHKRTHESSGGLHYKCDVCDKTYLYQGSLREHKRSHESARFECDVCEKSFSYKESLGKHKNTHENKRFECDVCKKSFAYRHYLSTHKKTHESKRFECDVCEKSFAFKLYLKVHKQRHENKRFECDICEKSFGYKNDLRVHKKMHEEFSNSFCKHMKTRKKPDGGQADAYPGEFSNSRQLIKNRRWSFEEEPTTVISAETETREIKTEIKQE